MDRASANAASHRLSRRDLARRCEARERRVEFWGKATAKLDALSKRVSQEERRKLETALEVRIPKPSSEEIRSYQRAQQRRQRGAEEVAALQGRIHAVQIELEKKQARLAELG